MMTVLFKVISKPYGASHIDLGPEVVTHDLQTIREMHAENPLNLACINLLFPVPPPSNSRILQKQLCTFLHTAPQEAVQNLINTLELLKPFLDGSKLLQNVRTTAPFKLIVQISKNPRSIYGILDQLNTLSEYTTPESSPPHSSSIRPIHILEFLAGATQNTDPESLNFQIHLLGELSSKKIVFSEYAFKYEILACDPQTILGRIRSYWDIVKPDAPVMLAQLRPNETIDFGAHLERIDTSWQEFLSGYQRELPVKTEKTIHDLYFQYSISCQKEQDGLCDWAQSLGTFFQSIAPLTPEDETVERLFRETSSLFAHPEKLPVFVEFIHTVAESGIDVVTQKGRLYTIIERGFQQCVKLTTSDTLFDKAFYDQLKVISPFKDLSPVDFQDYFLSLSTVELKELKWIIKYDVHTWLSPKVVMGMTKAQFELLNVMSHIDFSSKERNFQRQFIQWLFARDEVQDDPRYPYQIETNIECLNRDIFNTVLVRLDILPERVPPMPTPDTLPDIRLTRQHQAMVESLSQAMIDLVTDIEDSYPTTTANGAPGFQTKADYFLLCLKHFFQANTQEAHYDGHHPWDVMSDIRVASSAMPVMYGFNHMVKPSTVLPLSFFQYHALTGQIEQPVAYAAQHLLELPPSDAGVHPELQGNYERVALWSCVSGGYPLPDFRIAPIFHAVKDDPVATAILQHSQRNYTQSLRSKTANRRDAFSPPYTLDSAKVTLLEFTKTQTLIRESDISIFLQHLEPEQHEQFTMCAAIYNAFASIHALAISGDIVTEEVLTDLCDSVTSARVKEQIRDIGRQLISNEPLTRDFLHTCTREMTAAVEAFEKLEFNLIRTTIEEPASPEFTKKLQSAVASTVNIASHLKRNNPRFQHFLNFRLELALSRTDQISQDLRLAEMKRCFTLSVDQIIAHHVPNPIDHYVTAKPPRVMPPEVFNYVMCLCSERMENPSQTKAFYDYLVQLNFHIYLTKLTSLSLEEIKRTLATDANLIQVYKWGDNETKKILKALKQAKDTAEALAIIEKSVTPKKPARFDQISDDIYQSHKLLTKVVRCEELSEGIVSMSNDETSGPREQGEFVGINHPLAQTRQYENAYTVVIAICSGTFFSEDTLRVAIRSLFLRSTLPKAELEAITQAIIQGASKRKPFKIPKRLHTALQVVFNDLEITLPDSDAPFSLEPSELAPYFEYLQTLHTRWTIYLDHMKKDYETCVDLVNTPLQPLPKCLLENLMYDLERLGLSPEEVRKTARVMVGESPNTYDLEIIVSRFKTLCIMQYTPEESAPGSPRNISSEKVRVKKYLKLASLPHENTEKDDDIRHSMKTKRLAINHDVWMSIKSGDITWDLICDAPEIEPRCEERLIEYVVDCLISPTKHPDRLALLAKKLLGEQDTLSKQQLEHAFQELVENSKSAFATIDFPHFLLYTAYVKTIERYHQLINEFLGCMPIPKRGMTFFLRGIQSPYLHQYLKLIDEYLQWIVGNEVFSMDNPRYPWVTIGDLDKSTLDTALAITDLIRLAKKVSEEAQIRLMSSRQQSQLSPFSNHSKEWPQETWVTPTKYLPDASDRIDGRRDLSQRVRSQSLIEFPTVKVVERRHQNPKIIHAGNVVEPRSRVQSEHFRKQTSLL